MKTPDLLELKREVQEIQNRTNIRREEAFIVWFLRAFTADADDDEQRCVSALTGGAGDKSLDAIYIDTEMRIVFLLQGKYHLSPSVKSEKLSDVVAFAHLSQLFIGQRDRFEAFVNRAHPGLHNLLKKAKKHLDEGFRLELQYVTTGRVSQAAANEAEEILPVGKPASFRAFDRPYLLNLMSDYVEGAAPPVPSLDLPVHGKELFSRHDPATGISSWVFSMAAPDLGRLYGQTGRRLFARNIRGFLGMKSGVNTSMARTLSKTPHLFWYFNNGVTFICDHAREITEGGQRYVRVANAQIINGQQTTRVLESSKATSASTLIKLLEVRRDADDGHSRYSSLVGQIVEATNFQNAISVADLKSNDSEQVRLEREFKKLQYIYMRKRQSKSEARRAAGGGKHRFVSKEDIAKGVAACVLSPDVPREGRQILFDDPYYQQIFNGRRPAPEYLVCFWLHRLVRRQSRGDTRRGYAVYMVVNFIWERIGKDLAEAAIWPVFLKSAAKGKSSPAYLQHLSSASRRLLDASMAYYRRNRRSATGVVDESTFFQRHSLAEGFTKFWNSSSNKRRTRVAQDLKTFVTALSEDAR